MVFFYILLPESCASSLTKDFLSNVHASGNFLFRLQPCVLILT